MNNIEKLKLMQKALERHQELKDKLAGWNTQFPSIYEEKLVNWINENNITRAEGKMLAQNDAKFKSVWQKWTT